MIHGLQPGTFPGTFEAYQSDIHPDDKEQLLRTVQETLAVGRDHHIEYRIVLPDGRVRWVAGHGNIVSRADGKPVTMMGVCMDITEKRRSEQALIDSEMRYRTLFEVSVYGVILAHDLRNPLGAILTAAQLVAMRHRGDEETIQPIARIMSSGRRMTGMIEQLLDFTRARVGGGIDVEPREVDLGDVCEHAIGELQTLHPEWSITVESLGELGGTWDHDRLLQVVSNLVSNAANTESAAVRFFSNWMAWSGVL